MKASPLPVQHNFNVLKLAPSLKRARILEFYQSPKDSKFYYVILVEPDTNVVQLSSSHVAPSSSTYEIHRRYNDFVVLHRALLKQIKGEFGSLKKTPFFYMLPSLPPQRLFMRKSVAGERVMELDHYVRMLFQLPEKVTKSLSVAEFFGQRSSDIELIELAKTAGPESPAALIRRSMSQKTSSQGPKKLSLGRFRTKLSAEQRSTDERKKDRTSLSWRGRIKKLIGGEVFEHAKTDEVAEDSQVTLKFADSFSRNEDSSFSSSNNSESTPKSLDSLGATSEQSLKVITNLEGDSLSRQLSGTEQTLPEPSESLDTLPSDTQQVEQDLHDEKITPKIHTNKLLAFVDAEMSPRPPSAPPPPPPTSSAVSENHNGQSESIFIQSSDAYSVSGRSAHSMGKLSSSSPVGSRALGQKPATLSPLANSLTNDEPTSSATSDSSPATEISDSRSQVLLRERHVQRLPSKSSLIENLEEMEKQLADMTVSNPNVSVTARLSAYDAPRSSEAPLSAPASLPPLKITSNDPLVNGTAQSAGGRDVGIASADARSVTSTAISVTREKSIRTLMTATLKRLNSIKREESSDGTTGDEVPPSSAVSSVAPPHLPSNLPSVLGGGSPLIHHSSPSVSVRTLQALSKSPAAAFGALNLSKESGNETQQHEMNSAGPLLFEGIPSSSAVAIGADLPNNQEPQIPSEEAPADDQRGATEDVAKVDSSSPKRNDSVKHSVHPVTNQLFNMCAVAAKEMILRLQVTHAPSNSTLVLRISCNSEEFRYEDLCEKVSDKFSKIEGVSRRVVTRFIAMEKGSSRSVSFTGVQQLALAHPNSGNEEHESPVSPLGQEGANQGKAPRNSFVSRETFDDRGQPRSSMSRVSCASSAGFSAYASSTSAAVHEAYPFSPMSGVSPMSALTTVEHTSIVDQEDYSWWITELLSNSVFSPGATSCTSGGSRNSKMFFRSGDSSTSFTDSDMELKTGQSPVLPWERARCHLYVEFAGDPPITCSLGRPSSIILSEPVSSVVASANVSHATSAPSASVLEQVSASSALPISVPPVGATTPALASAKSPYLVVTSPASLSSLVAVNGGSYLPSRPIQYYAPNATPSTHTQLHPSSTPQLVHALPNQPTAAPYFMTPDGVVYAAVQPQNSSSINAPHSNQSNNSLYW